MILDIGTGKSIHFMSDTEGNKTDWFPKGLDIKCFVTFLDFHFDSKQPQQAKNIKPERTKTVDSVLIKTQI